MLHNQKKSSILLGINGALKTFINKNIIYSLLLSVLIIPNTSCKKMVQIAEPRNSITTAVTFSNDATAISAVSGIYNDMIKSGYGSGIITTCGGMSSDEMVNSIQATPFSLNTLLPDNGDIYSIWSRVYYEIFQANSIIEGLQASTGVTELLKKELVGEAKFIRAFNHFYLVNLFGDVPLMTSTPWSDTRLMTRTPVADDYQQIVADLEEAEATLPVDYSSYNNERVRATKWAAAAMLARIYLYLNQYDKADAKATAVINNSALFNIVSDLNDVFLRNSREAIWQLQPIYTTNSSNYSVSEAGLFLPLNSSRTPNYRFNTDLMNSIETNDMRKTNWMKLKPSFGYYPFKYKIRIGAANVIPSEYYMVLRLAEQYLIRAEARTKQNKLQEAIDDLNTIRRRAVLTDLSSSLNQSQILQAIMKENRAEFFAEWGHRWFDLKRTGQADALLGPVKGANWQSTDQLYPIPLGEIQRNPNLIQNPGYN